MASLHFFTYCFINECFTLGRLSDGSNFYVAGFLQGTEFEGSNYSEFPRYSEGNEHEFNIEDDSGPSLTQVIFSLAQTAHAQIRAVGYVRR